MFFHKDVIVASGVVDLDDKNLMTEWLNIYF